MEQPKDPQKELEIALGELEERVDRLRSLYEQYFMGYEKVEPQVQRKDVDRRFVNLRKQQIRNTALRFRFNVVTQRFNTYAMYWTRVCRQIEEGTYKRHIVRAERRFQERGRPGADRVADASIDVDLADFEDLDVDGVLAEADAAAEAYSQGGTSAAPDTDRPQPEPPGKRAAVFSEPPAELAAAVLRTRPVAVPKPAPVPQPAHAAPPPSSVRAPLVRTSPHAPMTPGGPPAPGDSDPDHEVPSDPGPRTPRHVALPPGARAVTLRRREGDPPASSRELGVSPRAESVRHPAVGGQPPPPHPPPSAPAGTTPRSPGGPAPAPERPPLLRPGTAPMAMPVSKPVIRPAAAPADGPEIMPTPAVPFRPAPIPGQRPAPPSPAKGPEPAARPPAPGGAKGAPTPLSPISPRGPGPNPRPPESRPRPAPGLPSSGGAASTPNAPGATPKKP